MPVTSLGRRCWGWTCSEHSDRGLEEPTGLASGAIGATLLKQRPRPRRCSLLVSELLRDQGSTKKGGDLRGSTFQTRRLLDGSGSSLPCADRISEASWGNLVPLPNISWTI